MHDLNLAAKFCDRLYLLQQGKIVLSGTVTEVLSSPLVEDVFQIKLRLYEDEEKKLHVLYNGIKA